MGALGAEELIDINISIVVLLLEEERAVHEMGVHCHPHEQHRHSAEGTFIMRERTCLEDRLACSCLGS